ncbi:hypothetical protein C7974DRAFT_26723 [Boeremia exigua]|uniref:uncharacterized protein n=1 Tax=Boeremia exigua TaxID=749465 RepID=UPI001E8CE74B|nr:uncharacterized protein C7974DRAFT_26723 [Boeremia exigua]KAH6644718.1 hypothetical protein C7974DRAFT_26723 [Boeremia exigua]
MENATRNTVTVHCANQSDLTLGRSSKSQSIFRGCEEGTKISPDADQNGKTFDAFVLKATEPSNGSAFVFFDFGLEGHELVLWISMSPQESILDVKARVVTADHPFDTALLQNLETNEDKQEEVGLSTAIVWPMGNDDDDHQLWVSVDTQEEFVPIDQSLEEYWGHKNPVVSLYLRDTTWNPPPPVTLPDGTQESWEDRNQPFFKIAAGKGQNIGEPIHENLTLAALYAHGVLPKEVNASTSYDKVVGKGSLSIGIPDVWEVMRGVFWNDDPACSLFNDRKTNNGSFAWGAKWGSDFLVRVKTFKHDNIIWRSHFGDLQALHAMGKGKGEHPEATRNEIMAWMRTMYCLSTGQGIRADDQIATTQLGAFFQKFNSPKGSDTLRKLILGGTPSYNKVIIERRAIGIMFHIIQDSYAVGHCRRRLLNPESMKDTTVKPVLGKSFKAKVFNPFPQFGVIHNFHSYSGQDDKKHGWYDSNPSKTRLNHADLNTFNNIPGARMAIEKCGLLGVHCQQNTKWSVVEEWLLNDVFRVSQHATASNTEIDENMGKEPSE